MSNNPKPDDAADAAADAWQSLWEKVGLLAPSIRTRDGLDVCKLIQTISKQLKDLQGVSGVQVDVVLRTLTNLEYDVTFLYAAERPLLACVAEAIEKQIELLDGREYNEMPEVMHDRT